MKLLPKGSRNEVDFEYIFYLMQVTGLNTDPTIYNMEFESYFKNMSTVRKNFKIEMLLSLRKWHCITGHRDYGAIEY